MPILLSDYATSKLDMDDIPEFSKADRREAPSGWLALCQNESVHYIIDALVSVEPTREFTQTELARFAGVSTQSVRRHIDRLVEMGVVATTAGGRRYHFNLDSDVGRLVAELNSALVARSYTGNENEDEDGDDVESVEA